MKNPFIDELEADNTFETNGWEAMFETESEFEEDAGASFPTVILGLDTASVAQNRNPNWVKAKMAAKIEFAIIRSNWGTYPDPVFARDWPKIKQAGMVRGAYLFLRFPTRKSPQAPDPVAQAKALIKKVGKLEEGDLPPSLDVEFPGVGRPRHPVPA